LFAIIVFVGKAIMPIIMDSQIITDIILAIIKVNWWDFVFESFPSSLQIHALSSNKNLLLSVGRYTNNTITDSSEHDKSNGAFISSKKKFISTLHLERINFFTFL
jgi:hypothetical protein